jgi:hypothetical protein
MKKILVLALCVTVFSCKSKNELLTGKEWALCSSSGYESTSNFMYLYKKSNSKIFRYLFSADGTVLRLQVGSSPIIGGWKIINDKEISLSFMGREVIYDIRKLEDDELSISVVDVDASKVTTLTFRLLSDKEWRTDEFIDSYNKEINK